MKGSDKVIDARDRENLDGIERIMGRKIKESVTSDPKASKRSSFQVDSSGHIILMKLKTSRQDVSLPLELICQMRNLQVLILQYSHITKLPPDIGELETLRELDLEGNELDHLPSEIHHLKNLHFLYLGQNRFTAIPEVIYKLQSLKSLALNNNHLQHLPDAIGRLQSLQHLFLDGNKLVDLPDNFGSLIHLKSIRLSSNELEHLPSTIGHLRHLTTLDASRNLLAELPDSLADLKRLEHLYLDHNQFRRLPWVIWPLPRLKTLEIEVNPWDADTAARAFPPPKPLPPLNSPELRQLLIRELFSGTRVRDAPLPTNHPLRVLRREEALNLVQELFPDLHVKLEGGADIEETDLAGLPLCAHEALVRHVVPELGQGRPGAGVQFVIQYLKEHCTHLDPLNP